MCTAISFLSKDHYFGRNLDLEYSYEEMITITPRNFPLHFRSKSPLTHHYALIGVAYIQKNYPLYYEATNENGLSMAGLHFPDYADYKPFHSSKDNIAPFEFIPWILCQCSCVDEARPLLENINLWNENFSDELPLTPLHWMLSDSRTSLVIECTKTGLQIYENPTGVMANAPVFNIHLENLQKFKIQSSDFIQLPGDWSSQSRFLRAVHVLKHSTHPSSECERVSQFFHILGAVEQPKGCNPNGENLYKYTIYSSCCNASRGIYYYKTYDNHQITAIDMNRENLDTKYLISYPMIKDCFVRIQNRQSD